MSEYRLNAYHETQSEVVESMLFGSRPSDEWVTELANLALLGDYESKGYSPDRDIRLTFEFGYIDVVKE